MAKTINFDKIRKISTSGIRPVNLYFRESTIILSCNNDLMLRVYIILPLLFQRNLLFFKEDSFITELSKNMNPLPAQ